MNRNLATAVVVIAWSLATVGCNTGGERTAEMSTEPIGDGSNASQTGNSPAGAQGASLVDETTHVYTEDFADYRANDHDGDGWRVRWCPGVEFNGKAGCDTPVALDLQHRPGVPESATVWVYFGDQKCERVRITFNYTQWERDPFLRNLADSELQYKRSGSGELACSSHGFSGALILNRTWGGPIRECFEDEFVFEPRDGDRSVYFRFQKGSHPTHLSIDDVKITIEGCE